MPNAPAPTSEADAELLGLAIRLAMRGRGAVEPNPMVGATLTRGGRVIGQGWHRRFGADHAERDALANCQSAGESPAGATLHVTLEPCCHDRKKTPPCAPALIEAKLARVVIGCLDPNPLVHGAGADMLRSAGIEVVVGVREAECRQLIAPFFARVRLGRPYVTLKWAQSSDAKVAGPGGKRTQISNARSMAAVHAMRARCDAILVGARTALNDNPLLSARGVEPARPLVRAVLDRDLELPADSRLAQSAKGDVVVYCAERSLARWPDRARSLAAAGVALRPAPMTPAGRLDLAWVLTDLGRPAATHLLVEPGPALSASLFAGNLADRVWVFHSPRSIDGDAPAATPVPANYAIAGEMNLDGDRLVEYLNPASAAFFGPFASPDLAAVQAHR